MYLVTGLLITMALVAAFCIGYTCGKTDARKRVGGSSDGTAKTDV